MGTRGLGMLGVCSWGPRWGWGPGVQEIPDLFSLDFSLFFIIMKGSTFRPWVADLSDAIAPGLDQWSHGQPCASCDFAGYIGKDRRCPLGGNHFTME